MVEAMGKAGHIFVLGDDVDTDQLAPGQYMGGGIEALAAHCLETTRPDFATSVQPGDLIVAGENFGMGSSREQAAQALRHLGVQAVIARSFAGIFYRNAINLGLPALRLLGEHVIRDGERGELFADEGRLVLVDRGVTLELEPIPAQLRPILSAGGLVPLLKRRFSNAGEEQA